MGNRMPEIEIIISQDGGTIKIGSDGPDKGRKPPTDTSAGRGKPISLLFPPDGYPDRGNLAGDDYNPGK
jgi:hypothetical protein